MIDLPLEIIHNIITIDLPDVDAPDEIREREEFLLPLCLLHSSLRRFVQRLLFAQVVLYDLEDVNRFLDTVEGKIFGLEAASSLCDWKPVVTAHRIESTHCSFV